MSMQFQANLDGLFNLQLGDNRDSFLYLFSPRAYSPQARRPLAYRFDTNMINATEQAMVESINRNSADVINRVTRDPKVLSCMTPTATPTFVSDYRNFEYLWTFMLVAKTTKGSVTPFSLEATAGNQCFLYYGFFTDEPINRIAANSYGALNHQAGLIVTHKTVIQQTKSVQPGYGVQYRTDVAADLDVVHGKTLQSLSNQQVFMMRPEDLNGKVTAEPDGSIMSALGDYNALASSANPITTNTVMQLPKNNLTTIIEAVAGAHRTQRMNSLGGSLGNITNLGHDTISDMITDNLHDVVGVRGLGLDENMSYTLGEIMGLYAPKVEAFEQPKAAMYSPVDQTVACGSTIFSSLLSTTIPPIMVNCGLAQIAFSYDSYAQANGLKGVDPQYVAPIIEMPHDEKVARTLSFFSYLERDIFPILINQRGQFSLTANCSVGGVSQITLNFYDDTIRVEDAYEVPNLLGGMNSALVGDRTTMEYNSLQLNGLVGHLVNTPTQQSLTLQEEAFLQQQVNQAAMSPGTNTKALWI